MPTVRTVTVGPGKDYPSLFAAEAGEQADLVALDRQLNIECYAFEDTTAVTIDGWTTDATRYINIYTPASERHDGKWNTSKYRLIANRGNGGVIQILESYVRIDGLQVQNTSLDRAHGICFTNIDYTASSRADISNNIVRGSAITFGTSTGIGGIAAAGLSNLRMNVWNNVVYDFTVGSGGTTATGIWASGFNPVNSVENNTVYNCDIGIRCGSFGTRRAYNNLAQNCVTDWSGTWAAGSNNASEDGTHPGTSGQTGTAAFVDATNRDMHLASGDTVALGNGADRSAGDIAFATDIDGQTRTLPWAIGADAIVSLATPGYVIGAGCGAASVICG